jgi:hypothetical protein
MELKNFDRLVQSITSNILEKLELKTEYYKHDKSCLILVPNIGFGMKDYYTYINTQFPGYNLNVGMDKSLPNIQYGSNSLINYVDIDLKSSDFINVLENVEMIFVLGLKISQMKTLIEVDDSEMYRKISNIVNDVMTMGIQVVNIQETEQLINASSIKSTSNSNELITENYVKDLYKNGSKVIVLNTKQLVTPLAKDKLRELKIEVKYVKEDNL